MGTTVAGERVHQTRWTGRPPWEKSSAASGDTNAFPHTITGGATIPEAGFYTHLDHSPFTNEILLSFAQQAIVNEQLGQDDDTDVLSVSFSANDYVGHRYGPYSQEVMDMTLRVDRQIATLLDFVQRASGTRQYADRFYRRSRCLADSGTSCGTRSWWRAIKVC